MSYKVIIDHSLDKTISKWKKSNPQMHKKFTDIFKELILHPKEGKGHPEPLIGGNYISWSRRITAHDRIIYNIHEDIVTVVIVQIEGHYNDK